MTTGPLEAIVLAAGAGARFGGAKLTAQWRGGALIDGALKAAFAAPAHRVIVVSGADPAVPAAVRTFARAHAQSHRLSQVWAEDHALGQSASLRAGLGAVAADTVGVYVFLGDMPMIPEGLCQHLADALAGEALAAAPIRRGRRGHPVLFAASLIAKLRAIEGDRGARDVLDELGERLALIETDDAGVHFDVDRR